MHVIAGFVGVFTLSLLPGMALLRYVGLPPATSRLTFLLLAVPISLLISPALLYVTGHFVPLSLFSGLGSVLLFVLILYVMGRLQRNDSEASPVGLPSFNRPDAIFLFAAAIGLACLVFLQLASFDWPHVIFPSLGDYPKHHGVIYTLVGSRLPPGNPFFLPGESVRLSYYYLFHTMPAVVAEQTSLSIGYAFMAFAFLAGLGFLVSILVWAKVRYAEKKITPYLVTALAVGGLDLLPMLLMYFTSDPSTATSFWQGWWDAVPSHASGWPEGFIKGRTLFLHAAQAPHHLAAMSLFFLLPLLVSLVKRKGRLWTVVPLAALSFFGSSVYLGILGVAVLVVFSVRMAIKNFRQCCKPPPVSVSISVLLTGLLVGLFAWEIAPETGTSTAGLVFSLAATSIESLPKVLGFPLPKVVHLLVVLGLALGPLLLLALLAGPKRLMKSLPVEIRWISCVALVAFLFVRSGGTVNDFGLRSLFLFQICLAIVGADALQTLFSHKRWRSIAMAGSVIFLSWYPYLHDGFGVGLLRIHHLAFPSEANRLFIEANLYLRDQTDKDAIIQTPLRRMSYSFLVSERRSVILDHMHAYIFNIDPEAYNRTAQKIANIFGHLDDPKAAILARRLHIDYLLVRHRYLDPPPTKEFKIVYRNPLYAVLKNKRW